MGIGIGLFLFAVGAIMRFAVHVSTTGFSIHTAGVILMIVGAVSVALGLVFWSSWGFGHRESRTVIVDKNPPTDTV